jgi:hypothetical protein
MTAPVSLLTQFLTPVLKPAARFLVGLIAIPMLRAVRSRISPSRQWDEELEKDLEQWFRASLVLFLATKNVETVIATWISEKHPDFDLDHNWWFAAGRLLLAIGVIESMPDQQLFSIIHPGPPRLYWCPGVGLKENIRRQAFPFLKGLLSMHLNRSSAVFAILAVIFDGRLGWIFYTLAILQYLLIGLVTSRDKVIDALSQFDREIARRRQELIHEFSVPVDDGEDQTNGSEEVAAIRGAPRENPPVPGDPAVGALPAPAGPEPR